jgi:hypothetical protein
MNQLQINVWTKEDIVKIVRETISCEPHLTISEAKKLIHKRLANHLHVHHDTVGDPDDSPRNHGKPWSRKEMDRLKFLFYKSLVGICQEMGRSKTSIYLKLKQIGINGIYTNTCFPDPWIGDGDES